MVIVTSKNGASVQFQSLFTCIGTNNFRAKCIYDWSLKVFAAVNSQQTRVFFTLQYQKIQTKQYYRSHIPMGVWAQTNLGGHQIFARKTSPKKKKKRSSPVSLHLFHHFRPKSVTKREAKQLITFFFWRCYCSHKFFGQNIKTLTQISRKIKNCPKFYKQGGQCPPGPPLPTPMHIPHNHQKTTKYLSPKTYSAG